MNKRIDDLIEALTSVKFTLYCLGLMMILVFFGTIAQVNMGTFAAQRKFFNHFLVYGFFPGGLTIGFLWLINLLAVLFFRFKYRKENTGLFLSHLGLVLLLLGQFLTQTLAEESRLFLEEGETKNYVESSQTVELAVVMTSEADRDQVTSIPYALFSRPGRIDAPALPFSLVIKQFFPNAHMTMNKNGVATQGVGAQISVEDTPVTNKDDELNNTAVIGEIMEGNTSRGTWLLARELGAPQMVRIQGKDYHLYVRAKRHYLPFALSLKKFKHDIYPGTDIPKNFSSLVHLSQPEKKEDRDVLIYMNHPLRYGGFTFYQASFGKNDTLSIFQVVKNPAWLTPYLSCALVVLGLLIQFFSHLIEFVRKPS